MSDADQPRPAPAPGAPPTPDARRARRLGEDVRRLLDAPNFAALATLMPDGSPKVEPVWVGREGDHVLVATDARGLKGRNLALDGRVALSITDYANPYEQALIRGRVIETRPDDELVVLDRLSQQYIGRPFPRRKWSARVVYVIEAHVARYYRSPLEHTPG
ncbi:MAG: TIGR03618 family F420-dependent PPOX class oxidoreductase [Spirochaetaceae bacterium]|nr:TIGR03618 family F420-dependent PPOX class oxidoreductase [Spirochaetaceae bacterium]